MRTIQASSWQAFTAAVSAAVVAGHDVKILDEREPGEYRAEVDDTEGDGPAAAEGG